jgi:hypothetical protein
MLRCYKIGGWKFELEVSMKTLISSHYVTQILELT